MPPGPQSAHILGHIVFGDATGLGSPVWNLVPEPRSADEVKRIYVSTAARSIFSSSFGGVVIDYWNGTLDTDDDGLPDWWESRYYGSSTNALPQSPAANQFSNLQCYWLGLDPTNPNSTFRVQAVSQPTGW